MDRRKNRCRSRERKGGEIMNILKKLFRKKREWVVEAQVINDEPSNPSKPLKLSWREKLALRRERRNRSRSQSSEPKSQPATGKRQRSWKSALIAVSVLYVVGSAYLSSRSSGDALAAFLVTVILFVLLVVLTIFLLARGKRRADKKTPSAVAEKATKRISLASVITALAFLILMVAVGYHIYQVDKRTEAAYYAAAQRCTSPVWECEFSTKDNTLTVGKKRVTAWFGQGMRRDIWANKKFVALSTKPNGAVVDSFTMPAGRSNFCANPHSSGNLEVRADSGTVLKFGPEY